MLWKHWDFRTGDTEVRRSRRLVISSISTVGNYDYGFYWYLYQDGTIEAEVKATGIIVDRGRAAGRDAAPRRARRRRPERDDPPALLLVRLDLDLDGARQLGLRGRDRPTPPGPDNPYGNGFATVRTPLAGDGGRARRIDPLRPRTGSSSNPRQRNAVGEPVGYKLVAGRERAAVRAARLAVARSAPAFAHQHVWVTPYRPSERYAAGDYPNQHPGGDGPPALDRGTTARSRTRTSCSGTRSASTTPAARGLAGDAGRPIGFMLKPLGFFDENPALDVAPPGLAAHCGQHGNHDAA